MSKSAKSLLFFSFYLFLVGLELLLIPGFFTKTFKLAETTEPYIRIVGVLAIILGLYYYNAARENLTSFFKVSIPGRIFYFVAVVGLVLAGIAPPVFTVFGLIDLSGAVWTWFTLRGEGKLS